MEIRKIKMARHLRGHGSHHPCRMNTMNTTLRCFDDDDGAVTTSVAVNLITFVLCVFDLILAGSAMFADAVWISVEYGQPSDCAHDNSSIHHIVLCGIVTAKILF